MPVGRARPSASAAGFGAQARGYRMDQVDTVVDSLEARIAEHDREIARLRGEAGPALPRPARPAWLAAAAARHRTALLERRAREDEPPPRPGPAAGRDEAPAAGRPVPLRRVGPLGPAGLPPARLLGAGRADRRPRTGYLSQGVQDQQAFEWYFGAAAHNLTSLANPLFSDLQNFPAGVNLMANAAVLGLGIPLAPLTLLAGPSVTFLVVELLGLALTASAWFWLFRRHLAVHPLAAAIGAGFVGFAPGHGLARQRAPELRGAVPRARSSSTACCGSPQGHRPVRDGVVLGLLAAWQVFIGEEVLLLTALGLAVGAVVYLAHGRLPVRRMLPGPRRRARGSASRSSPCRCGGSSPARRATATSGTHPAGNDLAQLWGRATRSLGADPWASAALSMNRTEENSFFGVPLLLAAGGRRRRAPASRPRAGPGRRRRRLLLALAGRGGRRQRHGRPASPARGRCSSSCRCSATCCPPASPSSRSPRSAPCSRSASRRCAGSRRGTPVHAGAGLAVGAVAGAAGAAPGAAHPARRRPARPDAGVLQRRHLARLGRRGRVGARGARPVGRGHPGPGVAGAGALGLPRRRGVLRRPGLHDGARRPVRRHPDRADPVDVRHHRERAGPAGRPGRGGPVPGRTCGRRGSTPSCCPTPAPRRRCCSRSLTLGVRGARRTPGVSTSGT